MKVRSNDSHFFNNIVQKYNKYVIIHSHGAVQVSTGILEYKWQVGGTRYVRQKNNWKQKSISFRLII